LSVALTSHVDSDIVPCGNRQPASQHTRTVKCMRVVLEKQRESLPLTPPYPCELKCGTRYAMQAMTTEELSFYMKEQLRRVGEERMVFASDAIVQIAKLSKGVPRVVNSICKAALLNVAMQGEQVVGVTNVESAWLEVNG